MFLPSCVSQRVIHNQTPGKRICRGFQCINAHAGRCEGVQGVLTLVFGEVAQAFHDDRIVELSGQLEEEEQEGIRTGDNHIHTDDHDMWMG